jgi:hypothetical protein
VEQNLVTDWQSVKPAALRTLCGSIEKNTKQSDVNWLLEQSGSMAEGWDDDVENTILQLRNLHQKFEAVGDFKEIATLAHHGQNKKKMAGEDKASSTINIIKLVEAFKDVRVHFDKFLPPAPIEFLLTHLCVEAAGNLAS